MTVRALSLARLAPMLALALVALAAPLAAQGSGSIPDLPFVFSTGTAELEVVPSLARLRFDVAAFDADAATARARVRKASEKVIEICRANDVPEVDVLAYTLEKEFEYDDNDERIGVSFERRFDIHVRNLQRYAEIVEALFALDTVDDNVVTFDVHDREAVEAELVVAACADARRRAELMATASEARLGPVYALSSTPFNQLSGKLLPRVPEFGRGRSSSGGGAPAAPRLVPGRITLRQTVHAIYRLDA